VNKPIKIVLLLDDLKVKRWVFDIINFVENNSNYTIVGVVINEAKNKSRSSLLYRILRFLDAKLFKSKSTIFNSILLSFDSTLVYSTAPIQKKYSDYLDEATIQFVQDKNPDVILRFGFRILRGSILGIPQYGIWSLHHGDNRVNRGGPPGFWEVVNQEAISGVTLQQITEDLDGGKVIGRAFTKTDLLSFHRNQVLVFELGVRLFTEKLQKIAEGKLAVEKSNFNFYSKPLFQNPSNLKTIAIGIPFLLRIGKRMIKGLTTDEQWIILHSKSATNETSAYRFQELIPPKAVSWADPFPITYKDKLFLFAEEIKKNNKGKIVCFEYNLITKAFSSPQTCIDESFHLSYPFVFEWQNQWYMIPETGQYGKVLCYKAIAFPLKWEKPIILQDDKHFFDVTPFEFEDNWYCFVTEKASATTTATELLRLYNLNEGPLGSWEEHPESPVKFDVSGGRSAGKIIIKDGKLFRPAQLGAPKYGFGIQFYEITRLTRSAYSETIVETITPDWDEKLVATHTFNQADGWHFIDAQIKTSKF